MKVAKLSVCIIIFAFWWFLPTRSVILLGKFHWIDKANLQTQIEPVLASGFLRLSLDKLKNSIMLVDGVESVDLWRSWPGDLIIRLKARTPLLRWQQDGLVDKYGVLFYSSYKIKGVENLANLNVPMAMIPSAVNLYLNANNLNKYKIQGLSYRPLSGWQLQYSKVKINLGLKRMQKRLERFAPYFAKIKWRYRDKKIIIDLRYTRGFSVKEYTNL